MTVGAWPIFYFRFEGMGRDGGDLGTCLCVCVVCFSFFFTCLTIRGVCAGGHLFRWGNTLNTVLFIVEKEIVFD